MRGDLVPPADDLAIFDVGGSNLFIDEAGALVPNDVIPMVAGVPLLKTLRRAFRKISPIDPGPSV